MGAYTAEVHHPPPVDEGALEEVAALISAKAPGGRAFEQLAVQEVAESEVDTILSKHLRRGKATGPDGVAAEFYIEFRRFFAPVLARLFSAMNALHRAPTGFTDGLVVFLRKDPATAASAPQPADLRPITLLGADYKAYSSVFARRMLPMLSAAVPLGQSAFLPGRLITDNVLTTRAVHDLLTARGKIALALDLDNLETLCRVCHGRTHAHRRSQRGG